MEDMEIIDRQFADIEQCVANSSQDAVSLAHRALAILQQASESGAVVFYHSARYSDQETPDDNAEIYVFPTGTDIPAACRQPNDLDGRSWNTWLEDEFPDDNWTAIAASVLQPCWDSVMRLLSVVSPQPMRRTQRTPQSLN